MLDKFYSPSRRRADHRQGRVHLERRAQAVRHLLPHAGLHQQGDQPADQVLNVPLQAKVEGVQRASRFLLCAQESGELMTESAG